MHQSLRMTGFSIRLRVKLPKQRALTTPYVTDALSDKAASVRRYAIATLTRMILTHPFGAMYGGFLNQPEWETRYRQVKEQLKRLEAKRMGPVPGTSEEAATSTADAGDGKSMEGKKAETDEGVDDGDIEESSNRAKPNESAVQQNDTTEVVDPALVQQPLDADDMANLTRLRLTKRYIADALEFIRQVEGSMDVLGQLLGSTSKAEVLESIEFFKVAYEYQMAGASVGRCNCLRFPHLTASCPAVWDKENAASHLDER
jgi:condensin complex subunit 1